MAACSTSNIDEHGHFMSPNPKICVLMKLRAQSYQVIGSAGNVPGGIEGERVLYVMWYSLNISKSSTDYI